MRIWECKIGECEDSILPDGADFPMRMAAAEAYKKLTGREPTYCFSGWGAALTKFEREVVINNPADPVELVVPKDYCAGEA
jgi:hypothetical protein